MRRPCFRIAEFPRLVLHLVHNLVHTPITFPTGRVAGNALEANASARRVSPRRCFRVATAKSQATIARIFAAGNELTNAHDPAALYLRKLTLWIEEGRDFEYATTRAVSTNRSEKNSKRGLN